MERIKKDLCSIFSEHSLKITTKNRVNFLNVTRHLTNGKYVPYTKANIPLYLHKRSNHPPRSTDNISQSFNNRLSEISYDEDHSSKPHLSIKKPLMTPDINTDSTFQPNLQQSQHNLQALQKRGEFSGTTPPPPPHSKNVAANVGRNVLKIFDEEFPKNIPIHQIFTRNTVKISYSCMSNIKQNIDRQNKSTIQYSHA